MEEKSIHSIAPDHIRIELENALWAECPSVYFRGLQQEQLHTWYPELQALIGVKQEPQFHPEGDAWEHTMLVLDKAAQLRHGAKEPLWFMLAALCHDFGKAVTTRVIDGRIRALGHEEAGMPLAAQFLGRIYTDAKMVQYVCNMLELHMRPNIMWRQASGDKAMCRLFDRSVCPEDLLLLSKADHQSRCNAFDYDDAEKFLREKLMLFQNRMQEPYVMEADLLQEGILPGLQMQQALEYAHKLRIAGVEKQAALKQTLSSMYKKQKKVDT